MAYGFKAGDRIIYTNAGKDGYTSYIGDTATVARDQEGHIVYLKWDDGQNGHVSAHNIALLPAVAVRQEILDRYVAEFDKIVTENTTVPRYTAIGFLSAFLAEIEAVK